MRHAAHIVLFTLGAAHVASGQVPTVTKLGRVMATSRASYGTIGGVFELRDGRVLVNDIEKRTLVVLDSSLAESMVLANDSTGGSILTYGGAPARLINYRGDSILFVEPDYLVMYVISPSGTLGRARAVPRPEQVRSLVSSAAGAPGFDARGRLVYRVLPPPQRPYTKNGTWQLGEEPADSAPIVRVDLSTRRQDTLAFTRIARARLAVLELPNGRTGTAPVINPMPVVDEWIVTSGGAIAIVRGADYHVDWVSADGKLVASPRIPFEWHRLTDEDRARVVGSVTRRYALSMSQAPGAGQPRTLPVVAPSELPDYAPPFALGSVYADAADHVWVQTSASYPGITGTVYDVIDRRGHLVRRVEIPYGRVVVGFGKGVVFLSTEGKPCKVERVRIL